MVEMILNSFPLEDGVLSLRCELRGTNSEAHITLMSSQDTVTVIDKLGKDGLTEVMDSVKTAQRGLTSTKEKDWVEHRRITFWELMED